MFLLLFITGYLIGTASRTSYNCRVLPEVKPESLSKMSFVKIMLTITLLILK